MTLEVQPPHLLSGKKLVENIWHDTLVPAEGTGA
jgi:hypothetical protein